MGIGVVLLTQGMLLDERRIGVLEWLLSKPLARPAVVLAKCTGNALALTATVVVIPWLAVHSLLSVAAGSLWSPARGAGVVALLALIVAFHVALVLALSTLTTNRVAVLAIPLVPLVSADGVVGVVPELFDVLPYSLGGLAAVLLTHGELEGWWPTASTLAWIVGLLWLAAVRMQHTEL